MRDRLVGIAVHLSIHRLERTAAPKLYHNQPPVKYMGVYECVCWCSYAYGGCVLYVYMCVCKLYIFVEAHDKRCAIFERLKSKVVITL